MLKIDLSLASQAQNFEVMTELIKVNPEGLDDETILGGIREGKYILCLTNEISSEERINKIRDYVARIDSLVTPKFKESIDELWNDIFQSEILMAILAKHSNNSKVFNKNNLMRIIGIMRENDVYEHYTDPQFNALLERTGPNGKHRRFLSDGLEREPRMELKRIINQYKI